MGWVGRPGRWGRDAEQLGVHIGYRNAIAEYVGIWCWGMTGWRDRMQDSETPNPPIPHLSVSLFHLGLPTTPAAPGLPPTEIPPPLSPPRGLVAVRTPRGVLLHWDPPELIPGRLDGYILEGRQGSQGWEILDQGVAGTEIQLLVPGLIKVRAGGNIAREGPVSSSFLIPSSHPDLAIFTSCPTSFLPPNCSLHKRDYGGQCWS